MIYGQKSCNYSQMFHFLQFATGWYYVLVDMEIRTWSVEEAAAVVGLQRLTVIFPLKRSPLHKNQGKNESVYD